MDEQALLHQISVDTNVNIELLKELFHNEEIYTLIRNNKLIDAILKIRDIEPKVGLRQAKMIAEAFAAEWR
jgi:(p)ppGpp synthase/HD superfamily hydrolase